MQQTPPISQAYLVIQVGGRWTDILRLQPGQSISIGRSSENQVVVREERVSRRHAELTPHKGGWVVSDLGSRNGTQVCGLTISEPRTLHIGDTITVGSCKMLFTDQPAQSFVDDRNPQIESDASNHQPSIVNRLAQSQWSAELDAADYSDITSSEKWSFFYKLIFDLVSCTTAQQTAELALQRLLSELRVSAGGVVRIEFETQPPVSSVSTSSKIAEPLEYSMAVLAAQQSQGQSYHRVSDYLVRTVLREQQAILARNIQDDQRLSVARQSGQHSTSSILCAPLRLYSNPQIATPSNSLSVPQPIFGILHIYTQAGERMLTASDLQIAVGVADNLSIALSRLEANEKLHDDLEESRRTIQSLQKELEQSNEMIGESAAMLRVQKEIRRAAPTNATVLIRGESGVGKELVARAIHRQSSRRNGPLVCLNCAALAPTLLESELFGHEKGAFTGATDRKIGKFEAAHRGTLFLDEIGEMPYELQAKFLRVLEGHPFERLGGSSPILTDVRVMAATNRDLEGAVRANQFRSDLYFRLRVVEIHIPPLRQRQDDIPRLVEHFLDSLRQHANRKLMGVEPEAMELLVRHGWSGNVRELRNVIERAVVLGSGHTIGVEDLSLSSISVDEKSKGVADSPFEPKTLEQLEKLHILATLDHVSGNKSRAAQLLGIERSTLDRKLKRY